MNKMMRGFRNALHLVAAASVVAVLVASAASAHHDDDSTRLRTRDNNTQDYEHVDLTPAGVLACDWGASQLGRSEITLRVGDNDIHCHDSVLSGYSGSRTYCTTIVWWNRRCGHYQIDFNLKNLDITPDTNAERNFWRYVGCHEFGHTGSISHVNSNESCMRSWGALGLVNPETLTSADLDHINDAL